MRNRWVLAVALVFTVFSLSSPTSARAQQGAVGFRSIEVTIASLVSLVIYLIPLIALLLGFDAIVGERERGSLDLLLALPDHPRSNCCWASTSAWPPRSRFPR
jgi:Cu-processing system permease protein